MKTAHIMHILWHPMEKVNIFWFRRDLRLHDNNGLYQALKSGLKVQPVFIFDKNILSELPKSDQRVDFIHQVLTQINNELSFYKSSLLVLYDKPVDAFRKLIEKFNIDTVFTNHDYEPYAKIRDAEIDKLLKEHDIEFKSFKDQVIFEKNEIVKEDNTPYTVFTPYSKKWKYALNEFYLKPYPVIKYADNFLPSENNHSFPKLYEMGFEETGISFTTPIADESLISGYHLTRDIPSLQGTSHMSVHLRFGTISIRHLTQIARQKNEKYLDELIWRDFYQSLLWHFPRVITTSFKLQYDNIVWRNDVNEFEAWCNGQTGYPIVDAGMRELNTTGWMHNRVRMITASFLTKHLLIDWRWGEAYFAKMLLDFDLASNNGGWQWAAGSGADAAPYFRIFNPYLQTAKFDPQLKYIRKWVAEFEASAYPRPIVDHDMARKRCLEVYKAALNQER